MKRLADLITNLRHNGEAHRLRDAQLFGLAHSHTQLALADCYDPNMASLAVFEKNAMHALAIAAKSMHTREEARAFTSPVLSTLFLQSQLRGVAPNLASGFVVAPGIGKEAVFVFNAVQGLLGLALVLLDQDVQLYAALAKANRNELFVHVWHNLAIAYDMRQPGPERQGEAYYCELIKQRWYRGAWPQRGH